MFLFIEVDLSLKGRTLIFESILGEFHGALMSFLFDVFFSAKGSE